jgi:hypothetical protein
MPGFPPQRAPWKMPSAFDSQGRPLWFDMVGRDTFLPDLVLALFNAEQFTDLERLVDDWSSQNFRRADGRWLLTAYQGAIQSLLERPGQWEAALQIIWRWREKNPYSAAAAITEAIYWTQYAWDARGTDFANRISPENWRLFQERLAKARAVLDESKPYASDTPLWGLQSVEVAAVLEGSRSTLLVEFAENARQHKDFSSLYIHTAQYLTPKWGGDWKLVDDFVRAAVKATEATEGWSMYARIYPYIAPCGCEDVKLLGDTLATWPDLKHGFDDLIRLYPHSAWDYNEYASFACIAGDKETYRGLRFRIGAALMPQAWPANYTPEFCDAKYGPSAL